MADGLHTGSIPSQSAVRTPYMRSSKKARFTWLAGRPTLDSLPLRDYVAYQIQSDRGCVSEFVSSEGSTKGYFSGERNATGRQLVRVMVRLYKEIIFEKLYPGNTTSSCEVCSPLRMSW
jgi:hypothetical protein